MKEENSRPICNAHRRWNWHPFGPSWLLKWRTPLDLCLLWCVCHCAFTRMLAPDDAIIGARAVGPAAGWTHSIWVRIFMPAALSRTHEHACYLLLVSATRALPAMRYAGFETELAGDRNLHSPHGVHGCSYRSTGSPDAHQAFVVQCKLAHITYSSGLLLRTSHVKNFSLRFFTFVLRT